jgi:hypothetical protein
MLEAGQPAGVRWLVQQPEPITGAVATIKFGQKVPQEWRAYIREQPPKYVPQKLRNKTGPFRLRRP